MYRFSGHWAASARGSYLIILIRYMKKTYSCTSLRRLGWSPKRTRSLEKKCLQSLQSSPVGALHVYPNHFGEKNLRTCSERLAESRNIHQMMAYTLHVLLGGLVAPYRELLVNLNRVARDDLATKFFTYFKSDGRFPGCCRPCAFHRETTITS